MIAPFKNGLFWESKPDLWEKEGGGKKGREKERERGRERERRGK